MNSVNEFLKYIGEDAGIIAKALNIIPIKEFVTEEGYKASIKLLTRGFNTQHFGMHLCGYLELPEPFEPDLEADVSVHGGITYNEGNTVGFDCAHGGDLTDLWFGKPTGTWRSISFVEQELRSLSSQTKELLEK